MSLLDFEEEQELEEFLSTQCSAPMRVQQHRKGKTQDIELTVQEPRRFGLIIWNRPGKKPDKKARIMLHEIATLVKGKTDDMARKSKDAPGDCCLSICGKSERLDLQLGDTAARDALLRGLHLVLRQPHITNKAGTTVQLVLSEEEQALEAERKKPKIIQMGAPPHLRKSSVGGSGTPRVGFGNIFAQGAHKRTPSSDSVVTGNKGKFSPRPPSMPRRDSGRAGAPVMLSATSPRPPSTPPKKSEEKPKDGKIAHAQMDRPVMRRGRRRPPRRMARPAMASTEVATQAPKEVVKKGAASGVKQSAKAAAVRTPARYRSGFLPL
ncbi:MAG: hypothetical protein MHM6MM_005812 [Cercozoa sp. M6MM]